MNSLLLDDTHAYCIHTHTYTNAHSCTHSPGPAVSLPGSRAGGQHSEVKRVARTLTGKSVAN